MSDELRAALFTVVGGIIAKLLDVVAQRRQQRSKDSLDSAAFNWEMAQGIMARQDQRISALESEMARKEQQWEGEKRELVNRIGSLQDENRALRAQIGELRAEIEDLKGGDGGNLR